MYCKVAKERAALAGALQDWRILLESRGADVFTLLDAYDRHHAVWIDDMVVPCECGVCLVGRKMASKAIKRLLDPAPHLTDTELVLSVFEK